MTSIITRRRRVRRESTEQEPVANVPPVLPVVTMTVQPDATLRVVIDGEPLGPPTFAPPWQRHSFAQIINQVIEQHHSPVRVLVHELDGTDYTDIVTTPLRPASTGQSAPEQPPASTESGTPGPDATAPSHLLALQNDEGFVPGEEVAVAVIIRHTGAGAEGAAHALIEPGLLDLSPTHEIVLLGRVSGTCIVGHPA